MSPPHPGLTPPTQDSSSLNNNPHTEECCETSSALVAFSVQNMYDMFRIRDDPLSQCVSRKSVYVLVLLRPYTLTQNLNLALSELHTHL